MSPTRPRSPSACRQPAARPHLLAELLQPDHARAGAPHCRNTSNTLGPRPAPAPSTAAQLRSRSATSTNRTVPKSPQLQVLEHEQDPGAPRPRPARKSSHALHVSARSSAARPCTAPPAAARSPPPVGERRPRQLAEELGHPLALRRRHPLRHPRPELRPPLLGAALATETPAPRGACRQQVKRRSCAQRGHPALPDRHRVLAALDPPQQLGEAGRDYHPRPAVPIAAPRLRFVDALLEERGPARPAPSPPRDVGRPRRRPRTPTPALAPPGRRPGVVLGHLEPRVEPPRARGVERDRRRLARRRRRAREQPRRAVEHLALEQLPAESARPIASAIGRSSAGARSASAPARRLRRLIRGDPAVALEHGDRRAVAQQLEPPPNSRIARPSAADAASSGAPTRLVQRRPSTGGPSSTTGSNRPLAAGERRRTHRAGPHHRAALVGSGPRRPSTAARLAPLLGRCAGSFDSNVATNASRSSGPRAPPRSPRGTAEQDLPQHRHRGAASSYGSIPVRHSYSTQPSMTTSIRASGLALIARLLRRRDSGTARRGRRRLRPIHRLWRQLRSRGRVVPLSTPFEGGVFDHRLGILVAAVAATATSGEHPCPGRPRSRAA